ncbi:MAG TPA: hypothetical protein VGG09_16040 [Acidimicrobiales bacterium]
MDTASPHPTHPVPPAGVDRRRHRRRVFPVAAALIGLAAAAAACSSNPSSPGVAGASSGTPTTAASNNAPSGTASAKQAADALAYSECMRSHGVSNFPDPGANGQIQISSGSSNGATTGLNPNNPTFQAASKACQSKLGPPPTKAQQAQALSNALKVSQCMRNHGIKDFPDPTTSGGHISMSIHGGPGGDLNPNDPLFAAAQKACMPNAPVPPPGDKNSAGAGSGNSGSSSSGIVIGPS